MLLGHNKYRLKQLFCCLFLYCHNISRSYKTIIRWHTVITKLSNYATDLLFWIPTSFSCCGVVSIFACCFIYCTFLLSVEVIPFIWLLFYYWRVPLLYFLLFLRCLTLYCGLCLWFEAYLYTVYSIQFNSIQFIYVQNLTTQRPIKNVFKFSSWKAPGGISFPSTLCRPKKRSASYPVNIT
jgi:hypothetical protein